VSLTTANSFSFAFIPVSAGVEVSVVDLELPALRPQPLTTHAMLHSTTDAIKRLRLIILIV
jgi:hypothetical protein